MKQLYIRLIILSAIFVVSSNFNKIFALTDSQAKSIVENADIVTSTSSFTANVIIPSNQSLVCFRKIYAKYSNGILKHRLENCIIGKGGAVEPILIAGEKDIIFVKNKKTMILKGGRTMLRDIRSLTEKNLRQSWEKQGHSADMKYKYIQSITYDGRDCYLILSSRERYNYFIENINLDKLLKLPWQPRKESEYKDNVKSCVLSVIDKQSGIELICLIILENGRKIFHKQFQNLKFVHNIPDSLFEAQPNTRIIETTDPNTFWNMVQREMKGGVERLYRSKL